MEKKQIEEWKSLDFLGYPDYQVSSFGRVKSLHFGKEKIRKLNKTNNGYLYLFLSKNGKTKRFTVHKLVALAFISNPENLPCVNHKDENKENNYVSNLEFCTQQYNVIYNNVHIKRGEKLKELFKDKEKHPMYGKHHSEETKQKISKIHKDKHLSEETKQRIGKASKGRKHTNETKQKISKANSKPILQHTLNGEFIREWESITQVEKELNIKSSNIVNCCKGKRNKCGGYKWFYKY